MNQIFYYEGSLSFQSKRKWPFPILLLPLLIATLILGGCSGCDDYEYIEAEVVEEEIEEDDVEEYCSEETVTSGFIINVEMTVCDGGLDFSVIFHVSNSYCENACLCLVFHDENGNPIYCNEGGDILVLKRCEIMDSDDADCEWHLFAMNSSFFDWGEDASYVYYDVYLMDEDGRIMSRKDDCYCFEL